MSNNNFIRGQINEGSIFYFYAYNKNNTIPQQLNLSNPNNTYYFVLCLSRIIKNNKYYHRIFWSCDPSDYTENLNSDNNNNGALEFTFKTVNGNYELFYITRLNNDPSNRERTAYGMQIDFNEFPIETGNSYNFEISPDNSDTSFNIGPVLYANIPYNISSGQNGVKPGWIFRQNDNGGIQSFGNQSSIPATTGNVGNFENLPSEMITNVTLASLNDTTLIIPKEGITVSNVPSTGTIFLEDTDDDEAMFYNGFIEQGDNLVFNIIKRGVNGTTETAHTGGTVYIYDRSNRNNFWYENENPGIVVNENFYLYFLPKEKNLYFPKGHLLFKEPINPSGQWTSSNSIINYNYNTGNLIYNLNTSPFFFINAIYNTLPNVYSFDSFDPNYNRIGLYNDSVKTIVLYTEFLDAQQNYFYSYCTTSQFCGNCMGLTKDRQNICTITSKSNDNYVSGNNNILSDIVGVPDIKQTGTNINLTKQAGSNIDHPIYNSNNTDAHWDNIYYPLIGVCISIAIIFSLMATQQYLITSEESVIGGGKKIKTFNNINAIFYCLIALPIAVSIIGFGIYIGVRENIETYVPEDHENEYTTFSDLCISMFSVGFLFVIGFSVLFAQGVALKEKEYIYGNEGKKIPNYIFTIAYVMIIAMIITYAILGAFIEIYFKKISTYEGLSEELYLVIVTIVVAIILLGLLAASHNSHINQNSSSFIPSNNIPMTNMGKSPNTATTNMGRTPNTATTNMGRTPNNT